MGSINSNNAYLMQALAAQLLQTMATGQPTIGTGTGQTSYLSGGNTDTFNTSLFSGYSNDYSAVNNPIATPSNQFTSLDLSQPKAPGTGDVLKDVAKDYAKDYAKNYAMKFAANKLATTAIGNTAIGQVATSALSSAAGGSLLGGAAGSGAMGILAKGAAFFVSNPIGWIAGAALLLFGSKWGKKLWNGVKKVGKKILNVGKKVVKGVAKGVKKVAKGVKKVLKKL